MASVNVKGQGTKEDPRILKTPPRKSEYHMFLDDSAELALLRGRFYANPI